MKINWIEVIEENLELKYFLITLFLFLAGICTAQKENEVLSHIHANGRTVDQFVPSGYSVLNTVEGDLNKDGKDDIVVVLKNKAEDTSLDMDIARLLLILFKSNDGYVLAEKSWKAILCKQCGGVFGDPFNDIEIKNCILTINHFGGSSDKWAYSHKFRYQNGSFYLIGKTINSYNCVKECNELNDFADNNYQDTNFVTGAYYVKQISNDCKLLMDKKGKCKVKPLMKLSDFDINF